MDKAVFTPKELRDEAGTQVAEFGVVLSMKKEEKQSGTLTMDLSGTMLLRPERLRPLKMELSGPVKLKSKPGTRMQIDAKGNAKFVKQATHK